MSINVPQVDIEALLISILDRLDTLESLAAPGNPNAFFGFGPSDNIKNQREQGYDRQSDSLLGGSGVLIENFTDAPNVWFRRRDNDATVTGFTNSTQIGRIGAIPMDRDTDGQYMWDNGTDGEMAHIIFRLRLPSNGNTKVGGFSVIELHVVDSRSTDPTPHPFLLAEFSGENGGRIIAHGINANGSPKTTVLFQPDT